MVGHAALSRPAKIRPALSAHPFWYATVLGQFGGTALGHQATSHDHLNLRPLPVENESSDPIAGILCLLVAGTRAILIKTENL